MKKFLVIGNPIDHSLSPKLHNYWIKKNGLESIYGKLAVKGHELAELCNNLRQGELDGINVTVPFKKAIIPHVDVLNGHALRTNSINTISVDNGYLIGHNTDIEGFEISIKKSNYDVSNKNIIILGAGGVVPSIIYALKRMNAGKIILSNRTREKAEELKKLYKDLIILDWGELIEFDMIINATSIGLNENDNFEIDFTNVGNNKFFYDVIYNPSETNFLKNAKLNGNRTENGRMMFIYQAHQSFALWNKILPKIDEDTIKILR